MLQRFHGEQPPVLPVSESEKLKKPMKLVQNRNDFKQGVLFNQGQIKWISDTKADVDGSFECGDICDEASGVYHVSRQDNKWVVDSFDVAPAAGKSKNSSRAGRHSLFLNSHRGFVYFRRVKLAA